MIQTIIQPLWEKRSDKYWEYILVLVNLNYLYCLFHWEVEYQ